MKDSMRDRRKELRAQESIAKADNSAFAMLAGGIVLGAFFPRELLAREQGAERDHRLDAMPINTGGETGSTHALEEAAAPAAAASDHAQHTDGPSPVPANPPPEGTASDLTAAPYVKHVLGSGSEAAASLPQPTAFDSSPAPHLSGGAPTSALPGAGGQVQHSFNPSGIEQIGSTITHEINVTLGTFGAVAHGVTNAIEAEVGSVAQTVSHLVGSASSLVGTLDAPLSQGLGLLQVGQAQEPLALLSSGQAMTDTAGTVLSPVIALTGDTSGNEAGLLKAVGGTIDALSARGDGIPVLPSVGSVINGGTTGADAHTPASLFSAIGVPLTGGSHGIGAAESPSAHGLATFGSSDFQSLHVGLLGQSYTEIVDFHHAGAIGASALHGLI